MGLPLPPIKRKIDILLKTNGLSLDRIEFEDAQLTLQSNFLLIKTHDKDGETCKIFDLKDVSAYKVHKAQ